MEIIGIVGDRGSFKTCLMTALLLRGGRRITANYHLQGIDYRFMPFTELAEITDNTDKGEEIEENDVGVDELGKGADSYDFMAKTPQKLTALGAELRKFRSRMIYTVQRRRMVTPRLRNLTDGFILMEDADKWKVGHNNRIGDPNYNCAGIARVTTTDDDFNVIREGLFFDARWTYKYFNSLERVKV